MNILVTNDDGVTAPGLLALAQSMRKLGDVIILAPDHNWSASGHVKTIDRPLRVREVHLSDDSLAFTSDGAPSDCVALAVGGFLTEKIDLIVSGINPYANFGHDVTYSGTVTAAMEAAIWGIPAVAISLNSPDNHLGQTDYSAAAEVTGWIVDAFSRYGLPPHSLINVNVPFIPQSEIKGLRITRLGLRVYHDKVDKRTDPRGRSYYWIIGDSPTGINERGTDIGALSEGYVSITPLQLDLTAYNLMSEMNSWEWNTMNDTKKNPTKKGNPILEKMEN
jgi:5'-nucleotidase